MNGRISEAYNILRRKIPLLLLPLLFLGLISCREWLVPPSSLPPTVSTPLPSGPVQAPEAPSEKDLSKTARVILDIPPPVSILPPLPLSPEGKETINLPPPELWRIVVKKNERKLLLYQKGELLHTYPIDLGEKPWGPKIHQGDMRTPEGDYRIIEKKDRGQTKYYLAFLLNYPNETDRLRYEKAVKEGRFPKDTGIGGLIEIHGYGKGMDWTQGCIALKNDHIRELFSQIPVGTPVKIEP
jgi:lipoprotein-anchoring transpeptidase ErfK/SrfK